MTKTMLPILLLLIAGLFMAGCSTNPCVVGRVVSVTERGFGVQVETSTVSANSTPTVKLGFFSSTVFIEPVLTNAVAQVPNVADTFNIDLAATPFTFNVNETIASGNYQTADATGKSATNSVTSQPIVPK